MTNTPNLVHEAEVQRHHVRVKLPAKVEINGIAYATRDWSTAGASVIVPANADRNVFKEGKVHHARMLFDFSGFSLAVPIKLEVRHASGEDDGQSIGLRYVDLTQDQVVIMRQLVASYVSGELTSVDEFIHILARNNFAKPRQIPKPDGELSFGERLSGFIRKAAFPIITILLIGYVALAIFEQKFIVSAEKALVTGDNIVLTSPGGGIISFKNLHAGDHVKKGDVLMSLSSDTGTITGVDSPCDCVILDRPIDSGTRIERGSITLRLIPLDTPLRVEAFVNYENAVRLARGQIASLHLPGESGTRSGVVSGISIGQGGDRAKIFIQPTETLPDAMVGVPVSVKINTVRRIATQE